MLFPDLGNVLISLTEDILAAYLAAEGISPTTGREKEKAQDFEPVRQHVVCAMKCGGAPSQAYDHHSNS